MGELLVGTSWIQYKVCVNYNVTHVWTWAAAGLRLGFAKILITIFQSRTSLTSLPNLFLLFRPCPSYLNIHLFIRSGWAKLIISILQANPEKWTDLSGHKLDQALCKFFVSKSIQITDGAIELDRFARPMLKSIHAPSAGITPVWPASLNPCVGLLKIGPHGYSICHGIMVAFFGIRCRCPHNYFILTSHKSVHVPLRVIVIKCIY